MPRHGQRRSGGHAAARAADLQQAETVVSEIVEYAGLELVDMTFRRETVGWVLRILVDKPGGVTLDDCAAISREVGDVLDAKELFRTAYSLEVSSPGVNRPLRREADFQRFAGQLVSVRTARPIDGRRNFKGRLAGCHDGVVELHCDGVPVRIAHAQIAQAHIEYEF